MEFFCYRPINQKCKGNTPKQKAMSYERRKGQDMQLTDEIETLVKQATIVIQKKIRNTITEPDMKSLRISNTRKHDL